MQGLQEWLLATNSGRTMERSATVDVEEREVIRRRMRGDKWTLDRGAGYYAKERARKKLPCLVQTGKHAGRTRVRYVGVDFRAFWTHILRRDFFTTAVNAKLGQLLSVLVAWYFMMLLGWSSVYYIVWRWNNSCYIGFHGFRSAFMYATETQQTIGYGERATGECWIAALLVSIHSLQAVLLDSVILGIVFSRISHPKQRSRTVLISDCACVARRDGQLKFMFRIADIQRRSVIGPHVRVVMYTWGPGRRTAEGERIPVTAQEMSVSLDHTLLLPVTAEHDVDEASPLFGHTLQSLEAVSAEVVVTFEASSELGDTFMARQSYLPSEIHWGHTFVNIIRSAQAQAGETQHEVDLSRFHDVEPQPGLGDEMTQPHKLSRKVVAGGGSGNVVPGRLLCENTLVLSEDAVVACRNGRFFLMIRLGDTFPGHVLDVQVTATLYRWHASHTSEGEMLPYEEHPLPLEPRNLLLRYPVTLFHELDPASSPVAHWARQKGMRQDADAEVVVAVRGTLYSRQEVVTRTRVYSVLGDVKWGHAFLPVVLPGSTSCAAGSSSKLGAAVDWSHFHATSPITMPPVPGTHSPRTSVSPRPSNPGAGQQLFPTADISYAVAAAVGAGGPAGGGGGAAGPSSSRPASMATAQHSSSRLSQVRPPQPPASPFLMRGHLEHSASTGSLSAMVQPTGAHPPHIQQPNEVVGLSQQQQLVSALQGPKPPLQSQPQSQQLQAQSQQQRALHRSPSALYMQPGGADYCQARPAFAAPGAVLMARRTDEDGATGGSEDLSSAGNTTSFGSGVPLALSGQRGSTGPTAPTQPEKGASEKTWHQTRSLFAALEGIQQYMEEQQGQGQGGEAVAAIGGESIEVAGHFGF